MDTTQVQDWLIEHNLIQMSRLLVDCDGRSLVYLNKYMKSGQPQQILHYFKKIHFDEQIKVYH